MIITRTPFRISFAGGGTDLKAYYSKETGRVISSTIDKYIYVVVKKQIGIVEHKYRINWSKVEFKDSIDEIEHPIVREALRLFGIDFPIEITTFTDIPGQAVIIIYTCLLGKEKFCHIAHFVGVHALFGACGLSGAAGRSEAGGWGYG